MSAIEISMVIAGSSNGDEPEGSEDPSVAAGHCPAEEHEANALGAPGIFLDWDPARGSSSSRRSGSPERRKASDSVCGGTVSEAGGKLETEKGHRPDLSLSQWDEVVVDELDRCSVYA